MAKTVFSNVCRVTDERLLNLAQPGIVDIPRTILKPRQIKVTGGNDLQDIPSKLTFHRETWIPVVSTLAAKKLVDYKEAEYMPQRLLSVSRHDYLIDPDVATDVEEFDRIHDDKDIELIIVAVIGDNRSSLAVCRNIVSGCQDMDKLVSDAKGAMESSNIFLIED